jgi:hypothetical protein
MACCSPWHPCTSWCDSAVGAASTRTGCVSCGKHRLWGSCQSVEEGKCSAVDDRQGSSSNQESVWACHTRLVDVREAVKHEYLVRHQAGLALWSLNTVRQPTPCCGMQGCVLPYDGGARLNARFSSRGTSLRRSCAAAGTSSVPCRRGAC